MNNPWVQGILCSLIATAIFEVIRRLLRKNYPTSLLLISVAVGTVVFGIGNLLEPTVRALLQGDPAFFLGFWKLRTEDPGSLVLLFFLGGLFPAIIPGLMVVKGNTLIHRLKYGAFWAPISLSIVDTIVYLDTWLRDDPTIWDRVAFSLLSNVFGGIVGGLIIGLAMHFYSELRYKGRLGLTTRSTATRNGSARRQRGR